MLKTTNLPLVVAMLRTAQFSQKVDLFGFTNEHFIYHLEQGFSTFLSTSSVVVLIFTREHRHKMAARTPIVYKYVKEHCPI
jgi:hypothetical protein